MEPIFFPSAGKMRTWLERNHDRAPELLVGFFRAGSGKATLTWAQAVDEALCFGWIDGIRRGRDASSYTIRFTPRRSRSTWSAVNIRRVNELTAIGRMHPSGLAAFARRQASRSAIYSYEQPDARLSPGFEKRFRANRPAWEFFQQQAPWYRRTATHFVMRAKRDETQKRRLDALMAASAKGQRLGPLSRPIAAEKATATRQVRRPA